MKSIIEDIKKDITAMGFSNPDFLKILQLIILHPSIRFLTSYRIQKKLSSEHKISRLLKRYLWFRNCRATGCHVSFDSTIEPGALFPHPTGIVIAPHSVIKSGATIFQNVTLAKSDDITPHAPRIEEGAIIYAGAVIIGNVTIGKNARIGANAVVKNDVAAHTTAVGAPARCLPVD